jgi:hypothetical protein
MKIRKFNHEEPKFKKGDRCVFVYPVGKYKIESVLDDNMVIQDEPFWNEERQMWSYPIVGKANPTEEIFLRLYDTYVEAE